MQCDVCSREHSPQLAFNCVTCARNVLYQPRIDQALVLVEKEDLGSKIAIATKRTKGPNSTEDAAGSIRRYQLESARTEKVQVDNKADGISNHLELLRREIKNARQEISARKVALAQRKHTMATIGPIVESRRTKTMEDIQDHISRRDHVWSSKHKKLEAHRAFLCREAAKLYGLRCRRRMKNGIVVEIYSIGGVLIPDLREINNMRPEELSAVIANISHFLLLTSHYLAVRLPAEITVPHRAYPRPTIFTPTNSYTMRDVPFPGTTPNQSSATSPTASRHADARPPPRPRPLFVEKRLPQLAQDDPTAYSLFIEAISLLAWDIAWLCRSQGFAVGTESPEDVCCIGKNLWQLFNPSPSITALTRARSSRDVSSRQGPHSHQRSRSLPRLGQYSHGSAYSFLSSNEGIGLLRGWKLTRYTTIADSLKRILLGEMSNAEWELLEQKEWDDGTGQFNEEETVFVKGRNDQSKTSWDDARSIMTARTKVSTVMNDTSTKDDSTGAAADTDGARPKGTSGWTKLKPR